MNDACIFCNVLECDICVYGRDSASGWFECEEDPDDQGEE